MTDPDPLILAELETKLAVLLVRHAVAGQPMRIGCCEVVLAEDNATLVCYVEGICSDDTHPWLAVSATLPQPLDPDSFDGHPWAEALEAGFHHPPGLQ